MTTMQLDNINKTEVIFEYDNGLPYKERIRPKYKFGKLKTNNNLAGINIYFDKEEFKELNCSNNILFERVFFITNEIWFDIGNVYLIIKNNDYLSEKLQKSEFILTFYNEDKKINSCGF